MSSKGSRPLVPDYILATHLRNAAMIAIHLEEYDRALPMAEEAFTLRTKLYGAESPWTADARAVAAFARIKAGQDPAESISLLRSACDILLKEWGPAHRHTRNAEKLLAALSGDEA